MGSDTNLGVFQFNPWDISDLWLVISMAIFAGNLEDDHFGHPLKAGEKNHESIRGRMFFCYGTSVFFLRFLNQSPFGQTFIAAVL
jgi:hypothetical protein